MTTTQSIRFDKGAAKIMACMTEPENPEAEDLKEMVRKCAMLAEDERDDAVLAGVLQAYTAVVQFNAEEEGCEEDLEDLVDDGPRHNRTYAAEKIWRDYVCAGYMAGLPAEWRKSIKECDDPANECYDRTSWYSLASDIRWPPTLLAEIAFAVGVRDARRSKQMHDYFVANGG